MYQGLNLQQVGSVVVTGEVNVPETGFAITGQVGSVSVDAIRNIDVTPSGLSATVSDGTATASAPRTIDATGQEITSGLGSVTTTQDLLNN